jgi:hypothetical protein
MPEARLNGPMIESHREFGHNLKDINAPQITSLMGSVHVSGKSGWDSESCSVLCRYIGANMSNFDATLPQIPSPLAPRHPVPHSRVT